MAVRSVRKAGAAARFGAQPRPKRRRVRRRVESLLAGLLAALLVAAAALALRLAQGPIELTALAGRIEAAINAELDGPRLSLGGGALTLAGGRGPTIQVDQVRVVNAAGEPLFAAPRARIAFRPLDLLLGEIRPSGVDVYGANARILRRPDGRFALALAETEPAAGAAPSLDDGPLAALETVRFFNADLTYDDRMSGRVWRARNAVATLRREANGRFEAAVRATVRDGDAASTTAALDVIGLPNGGFELSANVQDLSPPALALQFPAVAALSALEAPADGSLRAAVGPAGELLFLSLDLSLGAGVIRAGDAPIALDSARMALEFDPEIDAFNFRDVEIRAPEGRVSAQGRAQFERGADGAVEAIIAQVALRDLVVAAPAFYDAPAAFDGGAVTARVALDPLTVELAELRLRRGDLTLRAEGVAHRAGENWDGRIAADADGLSVDALKALWPKGVAPGAIAWVRENMEAGRVDDIAVRASYLDGAPDMAMSFAFSDATGHYLRPLPPITGARGWGEIGMDRFALTLAEGRVETGDAGAVDLAGSAFIVPSFIEPMPPSEIALRATGPIAAVLDVIDREPLALVSAFGLDPQSVEGTTQAAAELSVPLLKDLLLEDVAVDVAATVRDVGLSPPGQGIRLESERMALTADIAGLRLRGPARLDGRAVTLDWRETFSPAPGAPRSVADIATTVTPADLAEAGLGGLGLSGGSAPVEATLRMEGAARRFSVEADLSRMAFALPLFGWSKPEGAAARFTASGVESGALTLDRFTLSAPGLSAAGSARIRSGGGLERARVDRLVVGDVADVSLRAAQDGSRLRVSIAGARLDPTALTFGEGGAGHSDRAVEIDLDVDALALGDLGALRPARGRASLSAAGGVEMELTGALGGVAPLRLVYTDPAQGDGVAILRSSNAGALLRQAGVFADGVGGALTVEAAVDAAAGFALEGDARIDDMRVVDDPAIRRLIAEVAPAEVEKVAAGEGVVFSRISADFALSDGVLRVRDGAAVGPTVGLTLAGTYDIESDTLDMNGVFTPAYQVNAALGGIPLLGAFLTGGGDEGVFGVNYAVRGRSADPDIQVNPLSALLPGPFRKLLQPGTAAEEAQGRKNLRELERLREMMD